MDLFPAWTRRYFLFPKKSPTCSVRFLGLSSRLQGPEREADHLLPSNAEVKYAWSPSATPPYVLLALCTRYLGVLTGVVPKFRSVLLTGL